MALNTTNKIVRRSWDLIPMSYTVIARFNTLGGDQTKQLTFTYRHVHFIVYVEISGVGAKSEEEESELI